METACLCGPVFSLIIERYYFLFKSYFYALKNLKIYTWRLNIQVIGSLKCFYIREKFIVHLVNIK